MRLFLLLLTFTGLVSSTQAQQSAYIPIPDDARWLYRCGFWIENGGPFGEGTEVFKEYYFQLDGDTLINDTNYVLLHEQEVGSSEVFVSSAIRQDILERKVYVRSLVLNQEFLLYDFNITASDTIECFASPSTFSLYPEAEASNYWATLNGHNFDILDSVSNVLTGVGFTGIIDTRVFYFTESSWGRTAIWAEGIGNLMFLTLPCAFDGEFASCNLISFCTGDTTWYPWDSACDIVLNTGQSIKAENGSNMDAYWNGSSIVVNMDQQSIEEIGLIDLNGRQIYHSSTTEAINSEGSRIIGVPSDLTGLYIIQLRSNGIFRSQLILIN